MPRRMPLVAALAAAVAVAGCGARTGGSTSTVSKAPKGEIDLTTLSPQQLKPVSSQVDKARVRLHPQLVRVAGVGTDGFTSAEADSVGTSSSTAHAASDAEIRRQLLAFKRDLRSAPGVPVGESAGVEPGGIAVAPVDAPSVVAAVIQAGNAIARTPYKWGGGHGAWSDNGYDCSGSVSFALAGAGLLGEPLTSGQLMKYGAPGPGRWITIYANGTHTFMFVAGLRFDTSGRTGPLGTRWQPALRPTSGFVARHPPGL
jgi:cell wall-associated NlpC family hydrolase